MNYATCLEGLRGFLEGYDKVVWHEPMRLSEAMSLGVESKLVEEAQTGQAQS